MVKTQDEGKTRAKRGRPFKNLNISEASSASSSSTAKKTHKKRNAPDLERPWFQEQYLSLTPGLFVGEISNVARSNVANGRLARQRRLAIRRSKRDKLQRPGKLKTYKYFAKLPTEFYKNY
ncbi:hypothetical protein DY000_02045869 [Brassica cretica]|uniref:Uncharacterized protein n=1 Tax=Brassica cretica TaxID=69181 RepID=A0ABQ7ETZ6_BRACR|nr:hypothetical protein DY000_02045869 [Brassica cretica]